MLLRRGETASHCTTVPNQAGPESDGATTGRPPRLRLKSYQWHGDHTDCSRDELRETKDRQQGRKQAQRRLHCHTPTKSKRPARSGESPDCGNTALQELRNYKSELIISSLRLRYRFRPGWAGKSNTSPGPTEVILRWILGIAPFGLRITQLGGRLFSFRFS